MTHEMKLQPKYYDYILTGTKRIEIRLNDEKRQAIQLGDKIKFLKEPNSHKAHELLHTYYSDKLKNSYKDLV